MKTSWLLIGRLVPRAAPQIPPEALLETRVQCSALGTVTENIPNSGAITLLMTTEYGPLWESEAKTRIRMPMVVSISFMVASSQRNEDPDLCENKSIIQDG